MARPQMPTRRFRERSSGRDFGRRSKEKNTSMLHFADAGLNKATDLLGWSGAQAASR